MTKNPLSIIFDPLNEKNNAWKTLASLPSNEYCCFITYLSTYLSIYLSVYLSIYYLSISYIYIYIYIYIYLYIHICIYIYIYTYIYLAVNLSTYLCIYLPTYLSPSFPPFLFLPHFLSFPSNRLTDQLTVWPIGQATNQPNNRLTN